MDTFQKWVINLPNIDKKMNRTYSNFCNLFDELKEDGSRVIALLSEWPNKTVRMILMTIKSVGLKK
jgi:hypothetical protein